MKSNVWAGAVIVIVMGACNASEMVVDAGELAPGDAGVDAGEPAPGDAGVDAGAEPDASASPPPSPMSGVRDSGLDELDAGTDSGPAFELPTCVGEGVMRYDVTWCDYVPVVIRDYDCVLIWQYHSGGSGEWSGTAEAVRTATFTIDYYGFNPTRNAMYACHQPAPTELYRQNCETPFRRPCALAESDERWRGGVDYRPICAAARERGLASVILLNSPTTGCHD